MIDPVSLFLAERITDHAVELARGREIGPEWFFDDHTRPTSFARFVQADGLEMFQDRLELLGRAGEVKKPIPARAAFLVDRVQTFGQFFETGFVAEIALMIKNRLTEIFPDFVPYRLAREFFDRLFHFFSEVVIALWTTRETNYGDRGRQFAVGREIVKGRHELAMGQISGRAKNHHAARLRHRASR